MASFGGDYGENDEKEKIYNDSLYSNNLPYEQNDPTIVEKSSSPNTTSKVSSHEDDFSTTSVQKSSSAKPTYSSTFVTPPRTDFYKNVVMPQDDFKQVTYRYQVISFSHPTAKNKYTSVRTK
ncbi:unnamed protein product [Lupinus luteus]|uniref:Uncharacterized protein n=1 Tax=Lupinus luteus TaxID=3873 RepID=A0AAV1XGM3_LUPLU